MNKKTITAIVFIIGFASSITGLLQFFGYSSESFKMQNLVQNPFISIGFYALLLAAWLYLFSLINKKFYLLRDRTKGIVLKVVLSVVLICVFGFWSVNVFKSNKNKSKELSATSTQPINKPIKNLPSKETVYVKEKLLPVFTKSKDKANKTEENKITSLSSPQVNEKSKKDSDRKNEPEFDLSNATFNAPTQVGNGNTQNINLERKLTELDKNIILNKLSGYKGKYKNCSYVEVSSDCNAPELATQINDYLQELGFQIFQVGTTWFGSPEPRGIIMDLSRDSCVHFIVCKF